MVIGSRQKKPSVVHLAASHQNAPGVTVARKEPGTEGLRCNGGRGHADQGLHRDASLPSPAESPSEQAPPRPAGEAAEEGGPAWAGHLSPRQRRCGVLTPGPPGNFQRLPLNDKISFKNPRRLPCLRVHTAEVGTQSLSPDHRWSD